MKPEEHEVLHLLDQCTREIAKLETQLEHQRGLKSRLEERLLAIRSITSVVKRAPREIILLIFAEMIREEPMAIGSVLLVCRRWNQIACGTPTLWTTVISYLRPAPYAIRRQQSYLETAIIRSSDLPLIINVSLPRIKEVWHDIAKILNPLYFFSCEDAAKVKEQIASTVEWLELADEKCNESPSFTNDPNVAVHNYMIALFNLNGRNLSRAKKLSFSFGSPEFSRWIHTTSIYPYLDATPILEELTIIEDGVDSPLFRKSIFTWPAPKLSRVSWKSFSPLESILVDGVLTHLRFWLGLDTYRTFPRNSYTCNLHSLFLCVWDIPTADEWEECKEKFVLPSLYDLTLVGMASSTIVTAPSLITLRLVDLWSLSHGLIMPPIYPNIIKLHIWADSDELLVVERFVDQLSQLAEIAFLHPSEEVVKECMMKFQREGISVKGYRYPRDSYWSLDSYEANEVMLGS